MQGLSFTIFWLSFCAWVGLAVWLTAREKGVLPDRKEDRGSGLILSGITIVILYFLFTLPFSLPGANIREHQNIIFILGIVLMWFGIVLRFFAIRTLGKYFKTVVAVQSGHLLVTAGIYKYVRNPSYAGAWITFVGIGLTMGNALGIVIAIAGPLIGYALRIRVEEAALKKHFGDEYENYMKKTWALIPFIW